MEYILALVQPRTCSGGPNFFKIYADFHTKSLGKNSNLWWNLARPMPLFSKIIDPPWSLIQEFNTINELILYWKCFDWLFFSAHKAKYTTINRNKAIRPVPLKFSFIGYCLLPLWQTSLFEGFTHWLLSVTSLTV